MIRTLSIVTCEECCRVPDCPTCLELAHENCEEDCAFCHEQAERRYRQRYAEMQWAYYAPGGTFDNLFAGAFE